MDLATQHKWLEALGIHVTWKPDDTVEPFDIEGHMCLDLTVLRATRCG